MQELGAGRHRLEHAVGVEITGVDLSRPIDDVTFEAMLEAFNSHSVLLIRNQHLDPSGLASVARRFGPLERLRLLQPKSKEHSERYLCPEEPDISLIGNLEVDGKPIAAFTNGAPDWHIDNVYKPNPNQSTVLYAVETPPEGADTLFSGLQAAYDALDDGLKSEIEHLRCIYCVQRLDAFFRATQPARPRLTAATIAANPAMSHPLVRVHPATGRKGLFLAPQAMSHIEGMSREDSLALAQRLFEHAIRPEFQYRHKWRNGDFLIWDNLSTLHSATLFDAERHRRLLYRAMIGAPPESAPPP
jgi:taurine dioxygenase